MLNQTETNSLAAEIKGEAWYRTNGRVTRLPMAACLRILNIAPCESSHVIEEQARPNIGHLVTCFAAWQIWIDPENHGGRAAFDAMTVGERYEFVLEMDLCKVTN